jgi:hypothetical protein
MASAAFSCPGAGALLVAVDDAHVDNLLAASMARVSAAPGAHEWRSLNVCLGRAVSAAAICRLVSASLDFLRIAGLPGERLYLAGWEGPLLFDKVLLDEVVAQGGSLMGPTVSIGDCQLLDDEGAAVLAGMGSRVRELELLNATQLGDGGVAALAAGCEGLGRLVLGGADELTAEGVRRLLTEAKLLVELLLQELWWEAALNLRDELASMLAAEHEGGVLRNWVLTPAEEEHDSGSLTLTKVGSGHRPVFGLGAEWSSYAGHLPFGIEPS